MCIFPRTLNFLRTFLGTQIMQQQKSTHVDSTLVNIRFCIQLSMWIFIEIISQVNTQHIPRILKNVSEVYIVFKYRMIRCYHLLLSNVSIFKNVDISNKIFVETTL